MDYWYSLVAFLVPLASLLASGHAVLSKREPRSALTWVALIWLVPVFGVLLYLLFGINRIRRRASALRRMELGRHQSMHVADNAELMKRLAPDHTHLRPLADALNRITVRPLIGGNAVQYLVDGEEAYPAMLEAIRHAHRSVTLATYIFGNDEVGREFAAELESAARRGVQVRVLIDNAGERYSWPSMVGYLRRRKVPVARFFHRFPARFFGMNLRNHRKLLVVDGRIGFTGGMNIRRHHRLDSGRRAARDIQFRFQGPVVRHLQEVFYEDWFFSTGERLDGEDWFPELEPAGQVIARGIRGGPDDNLLKHHMALHAAIACARHSLRIVTPYFLPDGTLVTALNLASLRGVQVDIVLPAHNNLPFVHWAAMAQIRQVLDNNCRVWLSGRPFDHTKLLVVDDAWTFLGSSNWDPRSLRLNFEFNVECYDRQLAIDMAARVDARISHAQRLRREDVDNRLLPVRLRDGVARLLMPYL
ncbi:MAG: cardiolipin synthase [Ectothiorhodospiraceae bacterium]|nr:cardiolipin synthase [Ectothiorhodospiraceae bacterium]